MMAVNIKNVQPSQYFFKLIIQVNFRLWQILCTVESIGIWPNKSDNFPEPHPIFKLDCVHDHILYIADIIFQLFYHELLTVPEIICSNVSISTDNLHPFFSRQNIQESMYKIGSQSDRCYQGTSFGITALRSGVAIKFLFIYLLLSFLNPI